MLKHLAFLLVLVTPLPGQSPRLVRARHAIDSLAGTISGKVGAAAMIVETGDLVMTHGNDRFPMQSVYKLPIAMAVLQRVDGGTLKLSEIMHVRKQDMIPGIHSPIREMSPNGNELTVRELLRAAIVESDGVASDVLLVVAPLATVDQMVHKLGADSMRVVATERAMAADPMVQYRNWSTPLGAVKLLRALQQGHAISAPSRVLAAAGMAGPKKAEIGRRADQGVIADRHAGGSQGRHRRDASGADAGHERHRPRDTAEWTASRRRGLRQGFEGEREETRSGDREDRARRVGRRRHARQEVAVKPSLLAE